MTIQSLLIKYQIKRLRTYVTEINALKFKAFNISGAQSFLLDCRSRKPTGVAGGDKCGSNEMVTTPPPPPPPPPRPLHEAGELCSNECNDSPTQQGAGKRANECKTAQIFAFGANCPVFDADCLLDRIGDAENYITQLLGEVASVLGMSAGRNISIAITIEKMQKEIQFDKIYKYVREVVAERRPQVFTGEAAKFNYHWGDLSVSENGLLLYKATRFVIYI